MADLQTRYAPPLDLPFRFLALGTFWLAVVGVLYPWHLPLLLGSFYAPHALAFVHVNTLGVIASVVLGASYQLYPVVLQVPLGWPRLARASFWLLLPGQIGMVAGLATLSPWLLEIGGLLSFAALASYAAVGVATLWSAPRRDTIWVHLAVATLGLLGGACLGVVMAMTKGTGSLGAHTFPALEAHVTLMLAGWLVPLLTGVGYRLVGMFTLSEQAFLPGLAGLSLALNTGGAWVTAGALLLGHAPLVGGLLLTLGLLLFLGHLGHMYRLRRRRTVDIHMPYAVFSAGCGLAAAICLVLGLVQGRPLGGPLYVTGVWLAVAGWAQSAIQGFLYKIATFLIWLHRYAPLAGQQPVPRLEDLYNHRIAWGAAGCWMLGVMVAAAGSLTASAAFLQAASPLLMAGVAGFVYNAVRIACHRPLIARPQRPGPAPRARIRIWKQQTQS